MIQKQACMCWCVYHRRYPSHTQTHPNELCLLFSKIWIDQCQTLFYFVFVQDGWPPVKSHKQVQILNKMIFMMKTLCPFVVLVGNSILESNHSGSHK